MATPSALGDDRGRRARLAHGAIDASVLVVALAHSHLAAPPAPHIGRARRPKGPGTRPSSPSPEALPRTAGDGGPPGGEAGVAARTRVRHLYLPLPSPLLPPDHRGGSFQLWLQIILVCTVCALYRTNLSIGHRVSRLQASAAQAAASQAGSPATPSRWWAVRWSCPGTSCDAIHCKYNTAAWWPAGPPVTWPARP